MTSFPSRSFSARSHFAIEASRSAVSAASPRSGLVASSACAQSALSPSPGRSGVGRVSPSSPNLRIIASRARPGPKVRSSASATAGTAFLSASGGSPWNAPSASSVMFPPSALRVRRPCAFESFTNSEGSPAGASAITELTPIPWVPVRPKMMASPIPVFPERFLPTIAVSGPKATLPPPLRFVVRFVKGPSTPTGAGAGVALTGAAVSPISASMLSRSRSAAVGSRVSSAGSASSAPKAFS